jgi:diguanylate cyclase (GGDEF)-like protein/PAS domain S-box-containing protein
MDPAEIDPERSPADRATEAVGPVPEGLLRRALAEVPDPLLMLQVGDDGNLRCLTALGSRPTAPALGGLVGKRIEDILPPEALARFRERYHEAHQARDAVRYQERLVDGELPIVLEATLTPIFDGEARFTHVFFSVRDASQHEATAAALRQSEGRFQALFEGSPLGIAWVDPDGRVLEVNPTFSEMVGRPTERLLSASIQDLAHPEDRDAVIRALQGPDPPGAGLEVRLIHERGHTVWTQASVSPVPGGPGTPHRIMWQLQDTTERRGLQERLAHQALHDPLTGLPNRALFLDRVNRALSRLDRNPGLVAVMVLDIDRLDAVNDAHGHETGDRVLIAVGERLQESIRQADTIARLGSDEFGLLCEDLESDRDALALAERVRESVGTEIHLEGGAVTVSGSVGVALSQSTAENPETLLRDATLALHRAKAEGRARVEVFDESMREKAARRLKTETDLQKAIEGGEFRVFYQPQVELDSGTIVGVEVLARWQHPERGLVTPTEFIQLAEETGVILPLGQWVLEQACRQSEKWRGLNGGNPLPAWVNISPSQLAQPNFPELVSKILAEHGTDPASLCLEVTEGALVGETGAAVETLRKLKDLGIKVGLDDFGMGFSSLAYLKRLPVDMLKLDRTFVAGLGTNTDDSAIAAAVINLSRAMGLVSIAEGVETPEQLAELRELGCNLAQGYFFSSPQPAEVMEELLTQSLRW